MMLLLVCTNPLCGSGVAVGDGVARELLGHLLRKKVTLMWLHAWALDTYEA
jgi:hypothetical protein